MSNKPEITIDYLKKVLAEAAKAAGKHPSQITKTQLMAFDDNISDWSLRKVGGLSGIKSYFPMTSKQLGEIKTQKDLRSYVNKLERQLGDKENFEKQIIESIKLTKKNLPKFKTRVSRPKRSKNKNMTIEAMISDVHYGKLTDNFDLKICRKRMRDFSEVFIDEITRKQKSFNVDRVIIALIGDIIESFTMHGLESARSCEFGNPRQVQEAIESLFYDLILPVANMGIKTTIPAVTGNHDRTDTKKTYSNPGENHLSWIIYKMLESLSSAHKLKNVEFIIPKSGHTVLDIYGSNVLYEHGDELKGTNKDVVLKHLEKRGRQVNKQIHMGRFGHWHEYVCIDRGRVIINESVCGQDSYALEKGYDSTSGQTINFYVETDNRPTSFYYSFPVFLG